MCPIIGRLRCHHGDGNENVKGRTLLGSQNDNFKLAPRNFCTFLYRTARLTIWNCLMLTFYWQCDHDKLLFLSKNLDIFLKIQIQEISLTLEKVNELRSLCRSLKQNAKSLCKWCYGGRYRIYLCLRFPISNINIYSLFAQYVKLRSSLALV